ncbi:HNH endonuclease [Tepidibacter aestuarii]|uniref:HNH endonuclease n=1 Tax=Tepidibacter aestuarii TaxID=2925782 RepID=UPI0020BE6535|nr:HNH endonuclease signature motif containing protein [Tepidibacter aestuarii]CAH2213162.1 5-methylcytosine-specific restriction enzyme A [Tepidibacter aestuarii]
MTNTWIYSADPNYYDAIRAFKELGQVDWRMKSNVDVNDSVYIYIGYGIQSIAIKTKVVEINPEEFIDDSDYVINSDRMNVDNNADYIRLKMIDYFDQDKENLMTYELMRENGLNGSIRGPIKLNNNKQLKEYIELSEEKMIKNRIKNLEVSDILANNQIMHLFKCSNSSGMRRAHRTNTLSIISDHTKSLYDDRWIDGIFHYTGMGQVGDQSLDYAQNKVLYQSNDTDIKVYLFEVFEEGKYIFEGEVELCDKPYQEDQPDKNNDIRKVWVFPLKRCNENQDVVIKDNSYNKNKDKKEKKAKKLSNKELLEKAKRARKRSGTRNVNTVVYDRDEHVAELAKRRANGICQLCGQKAPFNNKKGEPYLETHHIEWLSRGGEDSIDNTVALCPNCHKRMHILDCKDDIEKLKNL